MKNNLKTILFIGACTLLSATSFAQKTSTEAIPKEKTEVKKSEKTVVTTEKKQPAKVKTTKVQKKSANKTKNRLTENSMDFEEAKKRIVLAKAKLKKRRADKEITQEQYNNKLERIKQTEAYLEELQAQENETPKMKQ